MFIPLQFQKTKILSQPSYARFPKTPIGQIEKLSMEEVTPKKKTPNRTILFDDAKKSARISIMKGI